MPKVYIYKQPDCEKFVKGEEEEEGRGPNILLYTRL